MRVWHPLYIPVNRFMVVLSKGKDLPGSSSGSHLLTFGLWPCPNTQFAACCEFILLSVHPCRPREPLASLILGPYGGKFGAGMGRLFRKIHPPQEVLEAGVGAGLQIFLFTPRLNAPLPNAKDNLLVWSAAEYQSGSSCG